MLQKLSDILYDDSIKTYSNFEKKSINLKKQIEEASNVQKGGMRDTVTDVAGNIVMMLFFISFMMIPQILTLGEVDDNTLDQWLRDERYAAQGLRGAEHFVVAFCVFLVSIIHGRTR